MYLTRPACLIKSLLYLPKMELSRNFLTFIRKRKSLKQLFYIYLETEIYSNIHLDIEIFKKLLKNSLTYSSRKNVM